MFVDRQAELAFLNSVLERKHPTAAQFVLLYGRRRVGKTVLLRHWAEQAHVPHTYWAAEKSCSIQARKVSKNRWTKGGSRWILSRFRKCFA